MVRHPQFPPPHETLKRRLQQQFTIPDQVHAIPINDQIAEIAPNAGANRERKTNRPEPVSVEGGIMRTRLQEIVSADGIAAWPGADLAVNRKSAAPSDPRNNSSAKEACDSVR